MWLYAECNEGTFALTGTLIKLLRRGTVSMRETDTVTDSVAECLASRTILSVGAHTPYERGRK